PGRGPVWLDGLTCAGSEAALDECAHRGWGVHSCQHSEDAGVICAGECGWGRGLWGGVCALTWDLPAARVTCRQLGCGPALAAAQVSAGAQELTWLENVRCAGSEWHLLECQVWAWGAPGCPRHATVTCEAAGEA
ncbi:C163A protein, partial [Climacteris rufus]|nr:C163A protein [Climacteris rufus]